MKNKRILFICLIFSITFSLSHVLIDNFYHPISSEEILLNNAKELSLHKKKLLNHFLEESKNTILSIRESELFNNFLKDKKLKKNVEDLFLTFTNSNENYMQLRFLDENGQERIKIQRKERKDKASIISYPNLQNKSKRYYFNESKYLEKNEVWFSPIELNIENHKIQVPYKPTIRAILAVYHHNEYKGSIIINYFADIILKDLTSEPMFKITLADDLGFIISSYDSTKNWGFHKTEKYNVGMLYKNDYKDILEKDLYRNNKLLSRSFNLDLFDNLYIIFEVNEEFLEVQKEDAFLQEVYLTLLYLIVSLILSFFVIRLFERMFLNLNEQKDILDRLELASNIANIAIWEFNPKNKEVIWTKNIRCILETQSNISYDEFINMIPIKERESIDVEFHNSIKEKREYSICHEIILENNKIKVLDEKGKHFYNNAGEHIKSVGCTYDVTQKHQANKLKDKITRQNNEFDKLFNKFDANLIASTANLKGIITYTSKAFCTISGYSKEELIGSPQSIIRHPDSPSDTFEQLWQTIQNGNIWYGEIKNRNKNGDYYWVDTVIYPEYNEQNKVYAYTAIRKDITAQKKLESLNKNIKSSIEVASFIQESILPTNAFINSCFTDKFIIWKPKDLVGGDIYFLEKLRNEDECLLMVIDCTGHGVPGAFVSMLIKAIEKQITNNLINTPNKVINPGEILQSFNKKLKEILKQKERNLASNVGFDGGIIYYNKKEKILRYAGASNTLLYYDKNEIKTIKGDRHSIGYKNSDINYEFKNNEIKVEQGMKFYLFSDGYIDQIGGEKKQSFSRSRTISILNEHKSESMKNQKEILLKELKNYQKDIEQIDDITFLAVEI